MSILAQLINNTETLRNYCFLNPILSFRYTI